MVERLSHITEAGRNKDVNIGEPNPVNDHFIDLPFGGIHDLAEGILQLYRLKLSEGSYGGIWFVVESGSSLIAAFDDASKYEGTRFREWLMFSAKGTATVKAYVEPKGTVIAEETRDVDKGQFLKLEESVQDSPPVHVQARFTGNDGRVGIADFIRRPVT